MSRKCSKTCTRSMVRLLAGAAALLGATGTAEAQTPTFTIAPVVQEPDIREPIKIAFLPGGELLILDKRGSVWFKRNVDEPVLHLLDLNVATVGHRGLLGIATDPQFAADGSIYIYLAYTELEAAPVNPRVRVVVSRARLTMTPAATLDPSPLWQSQWITYMANGGFGAAIDCFTTPQGERRLYIVRGDDGNPNLAQPLGLDSGKVFSVALVPDTSPPLMVATGLRNPFCCSVHPVTNTLYIADVGSSGEECHEDLAEIWEELNLVDSHETGVINFGWPCQEGPLRQSNPGCRCDPHENGVPTPNPTCAEFVDFCTAFALPAYTYNHQDTGHCIIGGPVYPHGGYPAAFDNSVFVADFTEGWIKRVPLDAAGNVASGAIDFIDPGAVQGITGMALNPRDGFLYYVRFLDGVYRISYDPVVRAGFAQDDPDHLNLVRFNSEGTFDPNPGDPPAGLIYTWDFGDGTAPPDEIHEPGPHHEYPETPHALYRARVSVRRGESGYPVSSNVLEVMTGRPPVIDAVLPESEYVYDVPVPCSATATDEEGNPIDDGAGESPYFWRLSWIHDTHLHPIDTAAGQHAAIATGLVPEGHSHLDIRLDVEVRDRHGLIGRDHRVLSQVNRVVVNSNPPGATVLWDGVEYTVPRAFGAPLGTAHSLSAAPSFNGVPFTCWGDGSTDPVRFTDLPVEHHMMATVQYRAAGCCAADINADGIVNSQDFFDFLAGFFSSGPLNCYQDGFPYQVDVNNDCVRNTQDFFDFLTSFFSGC